ALKQVQTALATADPSVIESASLAGKSVALQGLGTLEYLLYGTGNEAIVAATPEGKHRCAFAQSVARNIFNIAENLSADWASETGFAATFVDFGPTNPRFRNAREVTVHMFGTVVNGFDWVKDVKLKPVIGDTPEAAKPKRAGFWRSEQTADAIAANLRGLQDYLNASGFLSLLSEDQSFYSRSIEFEFGNAARALSEITKPPLEAFASEPDRGKLTYTLIVVDSLRDMMVGAVGPSLGVQSGFSVLDGD
ncbi:MAG: imelysin family protein, partial [Pseudomonadota bacterium]